MGSPRSSKRSKVSNTGRTRSFGGCATCRLRHLKCDEGKPTCSTCQRFGTTCGGYEKNIFFASADDDDGTERFRRPLFTEEEREEMSMSLVYSVPARFTLLNVLSQVDQECERAESSATRDISVTRGPFGAFKLARTDRVVLSPLLESFEAHVNPLDISDVYFSPSAFTFSPGTQDIFETFIRGVTPFGVLPDDTSNDLTRSRIEELFGEHSSSESAEVQVDTMDVTEHTVLLPNLGSSTNLAAPLISVSATGTVPDTAVHLLKHYTSIVVGMLTPSRNSKTLWHILFLPHVKHTLAALEMGEQLDHASLSTFYGTLAISSFHLRACSKDEQWYTKGSQFKQKAREHIRLALRNAYVFPKIAKYKTILMALLTMVQLSTFDGDWRQTETYLLESEKFIRLRGLHRRKSRKRRLLHHCYAFMRLFHESLFLMTASSLQRIHVKLAVESSGLIIIGQDRPSFRLAPWRNLVQKMLEVKSPDEGENDLHLEYPGAFSATMYPEIYGLPEEWLVMLSQVIRLGNEKDPPDGNSTLSLSEFSTRAKDLEQCIINWHRPPAELFFPDQQSNSVDERVLKPLLDALHQALIIYFYRRIYDVHASMLQTRVESTRDKLLLCDAADKNRVRYTSVFIWPAFMAACEAVEPELQSSFSIWFEDCVRNSGQSAFAHMYSIVSQVWNEKSHNQGLGMTWLDFMKNSNVVQ